jgi:RimJ/RimL family protein N-acetyltransferase
MSQIPTIKTNRLTLRPFTLEDAPELQRLAGDRAVADTTQSIPHPYEDGMAETWISSHPETFKKGQGVTFAITRNSDNALVGEISLMHMVKGHQATLGYWIGKPYWGNGFCTEAARAVLKYAFTERGLIRVHASHITRNPASGKVMQKLGLQHEGCQRQHILKWDKFEDLELYGILKEEWRERPN